VFNLGEGLERAVALVDSVFNNPTMDFANALS
jgi:hypothetical protein